MTLPHPDAPLAGVRVLDLTNVLAGPFCAYHLAALGADVIKVEEPRAGDLARALGADPDLNRRGMGASFLAQNAGKRSLAIDLKHPDGVAALVRLVETADVLVENFRPGVMRRLGLGYEVLAARRPKLVYAAISGFGASGPLRDQPAYDQIVQGYAGVMSVTGDAASAPLRAGFPVSDTVGGLTAALAIAGALLGAERTGRGCEIDVSMLEATLITLGWAVSNYLTAGVAPTPMGNDNMTASPSGTFRTGDGLLNVAANQQRQFEALCRVVGRPELVADPRFAEREARKRHRAELTAALEAALAARPASAWERELVAAGVPAGLVLSVPEVLDHPHVRAREVTTTFDDVPGLGRPLQVLLPGFTLAGRRPTPARRPPRHGEHGRELLREAGLDEAAIDDLVARGVVAVPTTVGAALAPERGPTAPNDGAAGAPTPGGER
ncbi:MAG: CoA transferase [Trueperaceae bacterium]|nr:CoA transferase [Trueperaceae bacterium]